MPGITLLDERYRINGVIDTNKPVLENLTNLCNSCGSWLTYDNELGKWGVIINRSDSTSRSFDDSNIIGAIEVQGVGLRDLYNSVMASFPRNDDIRGERDYVSIEIDIGDRNPNEVDNQLEIEYDLVTDPVQAELLAFIELKQSRINRSIRFRTDFTSTGVKAGDVIDVTSANYGFINELFRVITVTEVSDDNGSIVLDVLAMGYDAAVYDEDFTRYERTNQDGIVTIGAIGTPATPQITKFEDDVRPRLLLEATAPTGIVENIEFWLSYDNSDFNLLQAAPPYGGGVFTTGEQVEIDVDNVLAGNVYCKVRGINSTTVGPFSATASAIFAPRQTTDAIGPNTVAVDSGGNISTLLGILALLELLDDLMDGVTSIGGLWDKIFSIFDDETGVDIRDPSVTGPLGNSSKFQISASAGKVTASGLAQASTSTQMGSTVNFTCPISGYYKIDVLIDQNSSGARGGRGALWSENDDIIAVSFRLFGPDDGYTNPIANSNSGGSGAFSWTDFTITDDVTLTGGAMYQLKFFYTQITESNPTAVASFDISWNVYTIDTSGAP